ncbi:MAG: RNA-directed DNA polymerase [Pseudomonadales bacterium]|nr:RNA-directed DNA polymerase [Pseudomonadales bacterium]
MSVRKRFEYHYSEENLKRIFTEYIIYSGATGIDNLDQYSFRRQLNDQVSILSRKALSGTYQFSKYKLKLVSKGRGKVPREISIPTVRDRIAFRALCDFLTEHYKNTINFDLPQKIVKAVKSDVSSGFYNGYIKLDVANFYPSVNHSELESRLKKKIRNPEIVRLILNAISTPTVSKSRSTDKPVGKGVPQGLAISNILAAIYLINIDRYLNGMSNISYYRYVDDVLIFCNLENAEDIARNVTRRFSKIGLSIHDPIKSPEKSSMGGISDKFDYLGYQFHGSLVSARYGSIEKLKSSLVAIFTNHKHSKRRNKKFLLWRLNLRITGCVFENKSNGWLFFFSEINNESLLHVLDHYVHKLVTRFGVEIKPKKFVRAFKEIEHRKYETNYVPNFDNYDRSQMIAVLAEYFSVYLRNSTDEEVEFEFHKRIGRQVKDLLVDIKKFGY